MGTGMGLKGKGKFSLPTRGKTGIIYIQSDLVKDSQFPFKEGEVLDIEIVDQKGKKHLVISSD